MAPDLVRIQRNFKDQEVVFVSLALDGETATKRFADRHHITWPMGWGANDFVERYLSKHYPTLLVVGRDGRVAWDDGMARMAHQPDASVARLVEQIKNALSVEGDEAATHPEPKMGQNWIRPGVGRNSS